MKRFIITISILICLYFIGDFLYFNQGVYIDFKPDEPISTFTKTIDKKIYLDKGKGFEEFEIRGVNLGVGIPGHFATEYAIDKETYLRWFGYIQEMGANTIRVYTKLQADFYRAVYEFNIDNENPLYLIHGLWIDDYVQNSRMDAFEDAYMQTFIDDGRILIDIIHGNQKLSLGKGLRREHYNRDISPWVIGYILGVEWEDVTVSFTDQMNPEKNIYNGRYMYTTEEASPFEAMLARVGDSLIEYESKRYKAQRLVSFSNWSTTDPFDYPEHIAEFFYKIAKVDVENIKTTDAFLSGTFASYHKYPYYPDYLAFYDDVSEFVDATGKINTYYATLKMLNQHHTIPVVIAEFGVPSSRGMAQRDRFTGRNQGNMTEEEQGQAIVSAYRDIKAAGCAGSIIFTWQDEWFKRTWNTMHAIELRHTAYWSDYQTNEQKFGLLSFDPGKERSVSYVDGDISEWEEKDIVIDNGNTSLSMKYDEKFIYFLVYKKGLKEDDIIYIPIDTTQKTGSKFSEEHNVSFEREADFLIRINGRYNSRVLVQERYDVLRAMFYYDTDGKNPFVNIPDKNSPKFTKINLILQTATALIAGSERAFAEVYETGLLTYGNANPEAPDFNSLADFIINGDYIEVKLPWQLLNFASPPEMKIHDDYYEHYGVEFMRINSLFAGIGVDNNETIRMGELSLKPWGNRVTYHERLKRSYYIVKELWANMP